MRVLFSTIFVLLFISLRAQVYISDVCTVKFFSASALENIEGINNKSRALVNAKDGTVAIKLSNVLFDFSSSFMKEHFNENYMESEKYPYASFSGKLDHLIDLTKAGTYTVNVTGKLDMHGVTKERGIKATVIVDEKNNFKVEAKFFVKPSDHKIRIPSLLGQNIAEEVEVTFTSGFVPYKK